MFGLYLALWDPERTVVGVMIQFVFKLHHRRPHTARTFRTLFTLAVFICHKNGPKAEEKD